MPKEILFKSAPRIPKSEKYWKNKGKIGKDVCLIFHDDMDGIVSSILIKNYLINQGFKFVRSGYEVADLKSDDEYLLIAPGKGSEISVESELLRCESNNSLLGVGTELQDGLVSGLLKLKKFLV